MLRFANYDIVFREVPGEVTLAINISNCPHRCKGCHSPHLTEDRGEPLTEETVAGLLEKYGQAVTCVAFMGGDAAPQEVAQLAAFVQQQAAYPLKTAWYSGKAALPDGGTLSHFNYIKLGPYVEALGGLAAITTNQRFYKIENGQMIDNTQRFLEDVRY